MFASPGLKFAQLSVDRDTSYQQQAKLNEGSVGKHRNKQHLIKPDGNSSIM